MVAFRVIGVPHWRVSPFDGPAVVVADAGEHSCVCDAVFRLCHVVESGIVHNGRRVAVDFQPGFVSQAVDRHSA